MSTNVTWNGTTYSIPAAGETNWANLSNFLIALGNNAQSVLSQKWAERLATTSPITVVDNLDCVIVKGNGANALAVNLPAGVPGRVFVITDGDGNAGTYNITITPNGVETINGASSLVVNFDRGAVIIGFDSVKKWVTLAEYAGITSGGIPSTSITGLDPNKVVVTNGSGLMTSAAQVSATDANTASTIVKRDASGNFSAGTITADLTGLASNATTSVNFSGSLSGDVTGTQGATVIANGAVTNAKIAAGAGISVNKLAALTISSPVRSDGSGFLTTGQTNLTSEVTGALPIGNGGTGQTTANTALNALLPNQSGNSGKFLSTDGSNSSWTTPSGNLSAPIDAKNYGFVTSVAANALTIALKNNAGSDPSSGDPVTISFRNATSATGTYSLLSVTSALSMVVPSGASLGSQSGVSSIAYLYALNNAGTVELAISLKKFDTATIQSTTALSGASTSATTLYSTTARSNVAIRLLGRVTFTEATAGTWASNMSEISLGTTFLTGGLVGSLNGVAVPAGYVGERLSSAVTTTSCTAGSPKSVASVSLTPGIWDLSFLLNASANGGFTAISAWIDTTADSSGGIIIGDNFFGTTASTTIDVNCTVSNYRVVVNSTTTYYVNAQRTGSTGNCTGRITAVRVAY